VVIVGVDGSGKSKWARDVLSKTHAVLEPELLIHKSPDYDPNDPDVWGDFEWAEEKNLELTIQLLKDGGCFALPTTGKSLEMLEEIIAVAREEKYHLRLVHLDVPLAIAKRWNEQRVREVDSGTLDEQAARMPTVVRELSGLFDDVDVVGGLGSFFLGNGASKAV
jgi:predicted kinase